MFKSHYSCPIENFRYGIHMYDGGNTIQLHHANTTHKMHENNCVCACKCISMNEMRRDRVNFLYVLIHALYKLTNTSLTYWHFLYTWTLHINEPVFLGNNTHGGGGACEVTLPHFLIFLTTSYCIPSAKLTRLGLMWSHSWTILLRSLHVGSRISSESLPIQHDA